MAKKRRVFFSFYYQRDLWRVNQIRNSNQPWLNKDESYGFWDASLWESVRQQGEEAIKRTIEGGLKNTSVSVILIGAETSERKYVNYEIRRSHDLGKGMLGVYIHRMKDRSGYTDIKGRNPFEDWYIESNGSRTLFSQMYPTYDYVLHDGYNNLGSWVEDAAIAAGR